MEPILKINNTSPMHVLQQLLVQNTKIISQFFVTDIQDSDMKYSRAKLNLPINFRLRKLTNSFAFLSRFLNCIQNIVSKLYGLLC